MYCTANWTLGELLSIPGPTGCIVPYCSVLLNIFWVYAERFFFCNRSIFSVANWDLGELFSIPGLSVP